MSAVGELYQERLQIEARLKMLGMVPLRPGADAQAVARELWDLTVQAAWASDVDSRLAVLNRDALILAPADTRIRDAALKFAEGDVRGVHVVAALAEYLTTPRIAGSTKRPTGPDRKTARRAWAVAFSLVAGGPVRDLYAELLRAWREGRTSDSVVPEARRMAAVNEVTLRRKRDDPRLRQTAAAARCDGLCADCAFVEAIEIERERSQR